MTTTDNISPVILDYFTNNTGSIKSDNRDTVNVNPSPAMKEDKDITPEFEGEIPRNESCITIKIDGHISTSTRENSLGGVLVDATLVSVILMNCVVIFSLLKLALRK